MPPPAINPQNLVKKTQGFHDEFTSRKSNTASEGFKKDPFFAAFIECSKDHKEQHEKFSDMWNSTTTL